MACFAMTTSANAAVIGVTVDEANTTAVWLGSKAGLVNDPFAYVGTGDVPSPKQDQWQAHMYFANQATNTVDIDFDQNYQSIDLDIWGRDDAGGQENRHQNLTITFYKDHDTQTHQVIDFDGVNLVPTAYGRYTPPAGVVANRVTITDTDDGNPLGLAEVRAIGQVVPEPSTFALAAFGLLGLIGFGRRRKR